MWLAYKIYSVTENENLFTIRNTVSEKLFILLKLGCLGNACQPQKLINILGSEPWLLIKRLLIKKIVYVQVAYEKTRLSKWESCFFKIWVRKALMISR